MMLQETPFLELMGKFSIGSWDVPILGLIIFCIAAAIFSLIYWYISRTLSTKKVSSGQSEHLFNSIKFFQRIIFAIIILVLITNLLNVNTEYVNIVLGIIFTAITFASVKSLNNFIAGIYLAITRPFVIGDFINVSGVEGVIIELTLNYVKIKHKDASVTVVPNMSCVKSSITNYTISIETIKRQIERLEQNIMHKSAKLAKQEDSDLRMIVERLDDELDDMKEILGQVIGIQQKFIEREKNEDKLKEEMESKLKENKKKWKAMAEAEDERRVKIWEEWRQIEEEQERIRKEEKEKWEALMKEKEKQGDLSGEELKIQEQRWEEEKLRLKEERRKKKQELEKMKKEFRELREKDQIEKMKQYKNKLKLHGYSQYVDEDKVVKYSFYLQLDRSPKINEILLNKICKRWADEFDITPYWKIAGLASKITYQITVITPDPFDIIHYYDGFMKDVYETFYTKIKN